MADLLCAQEVGTGDALWRFMALRRESDPQGSLALEAATEILVASGEDAKEARPSRSV